MPGREGETNSQVGEDKCYGNSDAMERSGSIADDSFGDGKPVCPDLCTLCHEIVVTLIWNLLDR